MLQLEIDTLIYGFQKLFFIWGFYIAIRLHSYDTKILPIYEIIFVLFMTVQCGAI